MQANKDALLAILSQHIGAGKGVTAQALAVSLGVPARQVRRLVTELRIDGVAVCGHPGTGYFIAADAAELEQTCQFLRSRALHSLTLESRLRGLPLADLIGQMHLRT